MVSEWTRTPAGFRRNAAGFELAATDQRDRHCGWCWHVILAEPHCGDGGEVASGAGKASADEAKSAAEQYARDFCARTLAAIQSPAGA